MQSARPAVYVQVDFQDVIAGYLVWQSRVLVGCLLYTSDAADDN